MSINLKKKDITLGITKLYNKKTWRPWSNAFNRYAGTLKLKHFLNYKIQEPMQVLATADRSDTDQIDQLRTIADSQKSPASTWLLERLPLQLREKMLREEDTKIFEKEKVNEIPKELIHLVLECSLIIIRDELYLIYHESKKLLEYLAACESKVDQLFTVMVTTIDNTLVETVRAKDDPYEAYKYLKSRFATDKYLELKNTRKKFRTIRCPNLTNYLHAFRQNLAEYETLGGK